MFTFLEFLAEMGEEDVEDLSADELNKRAQMLKKQAQLKAGGREEQAKKQSLRALQMQMRDTKDPIKKADLGRRIKELNQAKKEEGMA